MVGLVYAKCRLSFFRVSGKKIVVGKRNKLKTTPSSPVKCLTAFFSCLGKRIQTRKGSNPLYALSPYNTSGLFDVFISLLGLQVKISVQIETYSECT